MNPILEQAEKDIEAKLTPDTKPGYDKIVESGLEIMGNEKTHGEMLKILQGGGYRE